MIFFFQTFSSTLFCNSMHAPNKSLEPTASTPFSFQHRRMLQLISPQPFRLPEAVAQLWR